MKKLSLCLCVISILFLSCIPPVQAEETTPIAYVKSNNGQGVNLRSGPGTTYDKVETLGEGKVVTIIETVDTDDKSTGCASGKWHKIENSKATTGYAYACTNYIQIVEIETHPDYNFEEELKKFPESYHEGLKNLHQIYPNAIFLAIPATNKDGSLMTFEKIVNEEILIGKSLIWDNTSNDTNVRDGLKHLDTYNYDTNSFNNKYIGGGANWYAANKETIAYYLDPRNFLNEVRIFSFETLNYNATSHTITGIERILSGTFMSNTLVDKGVGNKKFSDAMMDAAILSNISPYFIASRIKGEITDNGGRSGTVMGTYPNYPQYNGYYNFYNIGATGDPGKITENGLKRAKEEGWNSEYNAITMGASWIGKEYIYRNQNTQYSQKWDVNCNGHDWCYTHQYQQNIEAPYTESSSIYNAYKKDLGSEMYLKAYVFNIPVYENMPDTPSPLPSASSPIPYLSDLQVDGQTIPDFHGLTTEYTIQKPAGTTSVMITATNIASNKGGKVKGTGSVSITSDEQDIIVTGIAANGNTQDYTIHIKRLKPEESSMTLEETLQKIETATIKDNYISGLTSVETLKETILKANPVALVTVKDLKGNIITAGNLATGYTVSITVGNETKVLEYILYGDTNGDGDITILDLLRVQKQLLKALNLSGSQYQACDVNKDGSVSVLDLLLVQKHLLGEKYINQ